MAERFLFVRFGNRAFCTLRIQLSWGKLGSIAPIRMCRLMFMDCPQCIDDFPFDFPSLVSARTE
jgi:hypothetical protein